MMAPNENDMYARKHGNQIESADESTRICLESLIRFDYERCHPGESLEDLKHRARFSKEDKGLLRDWMALAAERATERRKVAAYNIAA